MKTINKVLKILPVNKYILVYKTPDMRQEDQIKQAKVVSSSVDFINEGDTVFFTKYSGYPITIEEHLYLFVSSDDVLGIIKETPK